MDSYFHEASGAVRFSVMVDAIAVGASVGRETLHYRYHPSSRDDDPLETYRANAAELEAAVRRRLAGGAREPVMLRDFDLRPVGSA